MMHVEELIEGCRDAVNTQNPVTAVMEVLGRFLHQPGLEHELGPADRSTYGALYRGNDLLVLLGPMNEHMMSPDTSEALIAAFAERDIVFVPGRGDELARIGPIALTAEGLERGLGLSLSLLLTLLFANLLMLSTSPMEIADAMRVSLAPLARWRVPVEDLALVALIMFGAAACLAKKVPKEHPDARKAYEDVGQRRPLVGP